MLAVVWHDIFWLPWFCWPEVNAILSTRVIISNSNGVDFGKHIWKRIFFGQSMESCKQFFVEYEKHHNTENNNHHHVTCLFLYFFTTSQWNKTLGRKNNKYKLNNNQHQVKHPKIQQEINKKWRIFLSVEKRKGLLNARKKIRVTNKNAEYK